MKKFLSMLLVAALLVTCMATVAMAAEPGETVTISFSAVGNPGFATYAATISYDSSVLELQSITAGALSSGGLFVPNVKTGFASYAGVSNVTGDGVLFTATFLVKENAAPGVYPVTAALDTTSTANAAAELVSFGIAGGEVEIKAAVCEHEWDEGKVTTEATCEEAGVKTYTCVKCGETKTESIAAKGHAWGEWEVTTEATCEEAGEETRVCANDETHVEKREIPAKGHSLAMDHDEEGHWEYCENCDYVGEKEEHSFDNNGYCECGYKDPNADKEDPGLDDVPPTGDITPMIMMSLFTVLGMGGTAAVVTKRKNGK